MVARVELIARSGVLNVCCPYTSRDEMLHAVRQAVAEKGESYG
jgi:undecaprenyl pyrophosphate synthase